jgi:tRNA U34 5-carboxymethylaminomethyl modifying GTPase MnmE/TrmE
MSIFAAVTTGKGTGAISTIQIFGVSAEAVMKKVFKPAGIKPLKFKMGEILLGTITDGAEVIDQVTIGCEGPDTFAINCHGNPLIVEMIMQLLQRHGAALLTAEQLLKKLLTAQKYADTIAVEAKLSQAKARTLQGTKILAN